MKSPVSNPLCLVMALLCAALLGAGCGRQQQATTSLPPFSGRPIAGGVVLLPGQGTLTVGDKLTISFPEAMVGAADIGRTNVESPVLFQPPLEIHFSWKSRSEGQIEILGDTVPGNQYRVTLRPGLKDNQQRAVAPEGWGARFDIAPFQVNGEIEWVVEDYSPNPTRLIGPRPTARVTFSHSVSPSNLAKCAYFQDTSNGRRVPAEVNIYSDDSDADFYTSFELTPARDLSSGRNYIVVIEGLKEAATHQLLNHLTVSKPAATEPLKLLRVEGKNEPLRGAFVRLWLSDRADKDSINQQSLRFNPPVSNLQFDLQYFWSESEADKVYAVDISGDFDTSQSYELQCSERIKSRVGWALQSPGSQRVAFQPKRPCVIFPRPDSVWQRATLGLDFSFLQLNTEKLEWKLAKVDAEQLSVVKARIREHMGWREDEDSAFGGLPGRDRRYLTRPLIPDLHLPVVASNSFPATPRDAEVLREIKWKPEPAGMEPGYYLLEATGRTPDGRLAGNRCLIGFSEVFITQKAAPDSLRVRVHRMSDGQTVAGAEVSLLDGRYAVLQEATTDENGEAIFHVAENESYVACGSPPQVIEQIQSPAYSEPESSQRHFLFSDRNLYRPGETVHFAGIVREVSENALTMPESTEMGWRVTDEREGNEVESGSSLISNGVWNAEWKIPVGFPPGKCFVNAGDAQLEVRVEEYRPPLFEVDLTTQDVSGSTAKVAVASAYFHGAPNARARLEWSASWSEDSSVQCDNKLFRLTDTHSPDHERMQSARRTREGVAETSLFEIKGESVLNDEGRAEVSCASPYAGGRQPSRVLVVWRTEITSLEGRTENSAARTVVQVAPSVPGIRLSGLEDPLKMELDVRPFGLAGAITNPFPVIVELFKVDTKTIRERTGSRTYRYRSLPVFTKIWEQSMTAPVLTNLSVLQPGHYAAVVRAAGSPNAPLASDSAIVHGPGIAEVAVKEATLTCKPERERYNADETAGIIVTAPFSGLANVSVEAGGVLRSFFKELDGNINRIEVPLDARDCPNVFVRVHLIRGGGTNELPAEVFGDCQLQVDRPETRIEPVVTLASTNVQPGEIVRGVVNLQAAGKPVAGAGVVVFATDNSVLELGEWELGDPHLVMYAPREHRVSVSYSLDNLSKSIERDSLWNKGFLLGDGFGGRVFVRRNMQTLAYWNAELQSDENGHVSFEFKAPDNLSSYRIVAVAQSAQQQFGSTETNLVISKRLQAEPALPRFVRKGDEFELRCAIRNRFSDTDEVRVRCEAGEGLQLVVDSEQRVQASRNIAAIATFRARATGEQGEAMVRFSAQSGSDEAANDVVEVKLRLEPQTILRRQTLYGEIAENGWRVTDHLPESWSNIVGHADFYVSGTEWLPKLAGLPEIIEYPHECMDQTATRALAICLLDDLLRYLPGGEDRAEHYKQRLDQSVKRITESAEGDKSVGYWPGAGENQFVTVECAWALFESVRRGGDVNPRLAADFVEKLFAYADESNGNVPPFIRSFALMVLSQSPDPVNLYPQADRLCLESDRLDDEGRAFLALALHFSKLLPEEKQRLLREVDTLPLERPFDPENLGSASRAAAVRMYASATIEGASWSRAQRDTARGKLQSLLRSSKNLSTQESFWVLLALNAVQQADVLSMPGERTLTPPPEFVSDNKVSVAWLQKPFGEFQQLFSGPLDPGPKNFFLVRAAFRSPLPEAREDRGLRLERVVRNLTKPERDGSASSPLKIGDEVLITYRLLSDANHYYVAVEDELAGALEVVNPNLPLVARTYRLPENTDGDEAQLSHSEHRDQKTVLYFNQLGAGKSTYAVLARVVGAGRFRWPGAQVTPMYDSRYSAVSEATMLHAVSR